MNRRLQWAQHLVRRCGLLPLVERLRYLLSLLRLGPSNARFIRRHPTFALPPAFLAFEAYSVPDWEFYKRSGEATAVAVGELLMRELGGGQLRRVLEWGCGPGRVIRHLRSRLPEGVEVIGTDYNPDSILWCRAHIPGVRFEVNALDPPLHFVEPCSLDGAIALSVFTHLSEETSLAWMREIARLLRPGGIFMFTTNGVGFINMLLPGERRQLDDLGIAVRANYDEGKKMYTSFVSEAYVRRTLIRGLIEVMHSPAGAPGSQQDLWLVRRS